MCQNSQNSLKKNSWRMVWISSAHIEMMNKVKIVKNGAATAIDNGPVKQNRKAIY